MILTRTPLSETQLAIAAAITSVPVYAVPPGDISHVPCAVIGDLRMRRVQTLGGLWEITYPVVVVGRSYDMDDARLELMDVLWNVIGDLERAGPLLPGYLRTDDTEPGVVDVGGHTQPAHTISVIAQTMYSLE